MTCSYQSRRSYRKQSSPSGFCTCDPYFSSEKSDVAVGSPHEPRDRCTAAPRARLPSRAVRVQDVRLVPVRGAASPGCRLAAGVP